VDPLRVVVRRGDVVEAVHHVHAVAVQDGAVLMEAGDPMRVAFLRSAAKPFLVLPLLRSRDDLEQRDLAIAASSHTRLPDQLEAVRALLAKAPAGEDELECGPAPTRLEHTCSGKHAGMLALCRARGWPTPGYRLGTSPVQQAGLRAIAEAAEADAAELLVGIDGCGIPTYAMPLERMALMFANLELVERGAEIAAAMRAYPALIGAPQGADTLLMQELPGFVSKDGVEGLLCAAGPDGLGLALKVEDGSTRALRPALAELLRRLGFETGELGVVPLENSLGELVGEVVSEP
jgi:L-asparaginase